MQEKIKEIASRVKEMRELSDLKVEDIAARLDITASQYRDYENGNSDIPASILLEIANILKVEMTVLLTGESPRMHIFSVTRKDKGVGVDRRKEYKYQSLASNFIHKKAEPFMVTVEPKPAGSGIHPNSHIGQEFNFVVEGSLKVYIHDNEIILNEGDSIYFDSSYQHAMEALDGKPARFLAIIL